MYVQDDFGMIYWFQVGKREGSSENIDTVQLNETDNFLS